jgi:riboflavin synthase
LNLERALKLGDRLGGHLVTGHVDGVGTLRDLRREGRSWRLLFQVPASLMGYLVAKGSVAVNGISLTVNGCYEDAFDVNVVPHTAQTTTIEKLQAGEEVNIETDLVGKYVEKMLRSWKGSMEQSESEERIDVGFLQKHGFID